MGLYRDGCPSWGNNLDFNEIQVVENDRNWDVDILSSVQRKFHFSMHIMNGFLSTCTSERGKTKSVVEIARHGVSSFYIYLMCP